MFYVIGKGWVVAGDLTAGDKLCLESGKTVTVIGSELEKLEKPIKVYNLEFLDNHTYFVSDKAVLVHNMYGQGETSPALEDSPYNPDAVDARNKPPYKSNPQHDSHSSTFKPDKDPEPLDAASVYDNAYRGDMYTWYGRGEEGIYRFFSDVDLRNVHFSGILKGSELLHTPNWIRKILEIKV